MKSILRKVVFLPIVIAVLASSTAQAQLGATVRNWPAPATYTPARAAVTTMGDVTNPLPFIAVTPCRIVDTRNAPGPFGGPAIAGGTSRSFALPAGPCTGLSSLPRAYSLNITATNTTGPGFFKIWPTGAPEPLVSTLNYLAGQTIANAAIVPAGTSGAITVKAGVSTADLIIDINGYYPVSNATNPLNPNEVFSIVGNFSGGSMIVGENLESTGINSRGGLFITHSTGGGSAGVFGTAIATSGSPSGVLGTTSGNSGSGVKGLGPHGVNGNTENIGLSGVRGAVNDSGTGTLLAAGHLGASNNVTGVGNRGVFGFTVETANDTAGIEGQTADVVTAGTGFPTSGLRGESEAGIGVLGISTANGVYGTLKNGKAGILGASNRMANGSTQDWGVLALGDIGATGVKKFVEPDASDANRQIEYVALEGPEPGTYCRGTSRTYLGTAVIQVPEDFSTVTDENALTVQLTPVGELATMAVLSEDLHRIVVASSKDVTFHYLIQGVRRAFKDYRPVREAGVFVPASPQARMQGSLPEEIQRRLIANGTYNADGTVNMTTARRVGWTKIWERETHTHAAAEEARQQ